MDPALLKQQAAFKARASQVLENLSQKNSPSTSHTTYEYVFFSAVSFCLIFYGDFNVWKILVQKQVGRKNVKYTTIHNYQSSVIFYILSSVLCRSSIIKEFLAK